jgi:hypothetical protein
MADDSSFLFTRPKFDSESPQANARKFFSASGPTPNFCQVMQCELEDRSLDHILRCPLKLHHYPVCRIRGKPAGL